MFASFVSIQFVLKQFFWRHFYMRKFKKIYSLNVHFLSQRSNATEEITWKPQLHNGDTDAVMSHDQLINYWNLPDPKLGTNFPIRIFYARSLSCKSQTYNVTKHKSQFRIFQVCSNSTNFYKIVDHAFLEFIS